MAKSRDDLYQDLKYEFEDLPDSSEKAYFIHRLIDVEAYLLSQDDKEFAFGDPAYDELQFLKEDLNKLKYAVHSNDFMGLHELEQDYFQLPNSELSKLVLAVVVAAMTAVAGMVLGALVGAALTSWAGPVAALGAFFGAIKGAALGWEAGVVAGAAVAGVTTGAVAKFGLFKSPKSKMNHAVQAGQKLLESELVKNSPKINGRSPIVRNGQVLY